MGINLLPAVSAGSAKWAEWSHKVVAVTTAILVVHIVAAAATAGWWWYLRDRQTRLSAEVAQLQAKIDSLAQAEVWQRLVADRVGAITEVLDGRPAVAAAATRLVGQPGVTVVGWQRETDKLSTVSVVAGSAQAIENYAQFLTAFYRRVTLTTLTGDGGGIWQATITLDL